MGKRRAPRKNNFWNDQSKLEDWYVWYEKRRNKIRFAIASKIIGKEGWQTFSAAYMQTRIDARLREIERSIPKTFDEAARLMPPWIEGVSQS